MNLSTPGMVHREPGFGFFQLIKQRKIAAHIFQVAGRLPEHASA